MKKAIAFLAISVLSGISMTASAAANPTMQKFQKISDDYLDLVYFPYNPTAGTLSGYHQYDTQLEDYSRKSLDAQIAALKTFDARITVIAPDGLDQTARGDREMVLGN